MATTRGEITAKQYESARKAFVQIMKQRLKLIHRFHLNTSRTAKPLETRMGKGKGDISHWSFLIRPGRIIFEVKVFDRKHEEVINGLKAASYKLPFRVKILHRKSIEVAS